MSKILILLLVIFPGVLAGKLLQEENPGNGILVPQGGTTNLQQQCLTNLCSRYNLRLSAGFYCLPGASQYLWCAEGRGYVFNCPRGTACNCDYTRNTPCVFPGDTSVCYTLGIGNSVQECYPTPTPTPSPTPVPCDLRPINNTSFRYQYGQKFVLANHPSANRPFAGPQAGGILLSDLWGIGDYVGRFDDVRMHIAGPNFLHIYGVITILPNNTRWNIDYRYYGNVTIVDTPRPEVTVAKDPTSGGYLKEIGGPGFFALVDPPYNIPIVLELHQGIYLNYPDDLRHGGSGWFWTHPQTLKQGCCQDWQFLIEGVCYVPTPVPTPTASPTALPTPTPSATPDPRITCSCYIPVETNPPGCGGPSHIGEDGSRADSGQVVQDEKMAPSTKGDMDIIYIMLAVCVSAVAVAGVIFVIKQIRNFRQNRHFEDLMRNAESRNASIVSPRVRSHSEVHPRRTAVEMLGA